MIDILIFVKIIIDYLTQELELDASRELLDFVNGITEMDKENFVGAFNE